MKPQQKKTPCETKGHFWQSTASPFIHRCGRTGCKAMRHSINDTWTETQPNQSKKPVVPLAEQSNLWA